jgi:outer membrane lipoprotein SlyB
MDNMTGATAATKRTHPMFIVAAGAVTLLCAVGIGVLTGVIPSANSGASSTTAPTVPSPVAAGIASAPVGSADSSALPETKDSGLKPIENKALGQPLSKTENSARKTETHKTAPAVHVAESQPKAPKLDELPPNSTPPGPMVVASAPVCRNCGVIDSITPIEKKGEGSGAGAVIGGVLGGVLAHQVGGGRGKDLATVAGAVGGAMAGNAIEKNSKTSKSYDVRVKFADNTFQTVRYDTEPGVRVGDKVRLEGGKLTRE